MQIFILAKAPVPGHVKTRLAEVAGARVATEVYSEVAEHVVWAAAETGMPTTLACAPGPAHPFFHRLCRRYAVALRAQPGGSLGSRLQRLLHAGTELHGTAAVAGADCAGLTPALIQSAARVLEAGSEATVAPARDGGYVLLAARQAYPALFRGIPWSTSEVMAATRRRARSAGIDLAELPASWDLDDEQDWRRWRRVARNGPRGA